MSGVSNHRLSVMLLAAAALSGFSALVYQVAWMRMLSQVFGVTVFAVTTVVAVFMAGLAIGSLVAGRYVDRVDSVSAYFRLYALLEGGIALYALLIPLLIKLSSMVYEPVYQLAAIDFTLFSFIRFIVCAAILLLPTILMGATLPVLVRSYHALASLPDAHRAGVSLGKVYGLNTAGAVAGVLIAGFVLVPELGVSGALYVAIIINVLLAGGAYYSSRLQSVYTVPLPAHVEKISQKSIDTDDYLLSSMDIVRTAVVVAFFFSGFIALAYEVIWFRVLSMTIGGSVYAFSIMLAVFLTGVASGSYVLAKNLSRVRDKLWMFAWLEILLGISVLATVPLMGTLHEYFMQFVAWAGFSFSAFQFVNVLMALMIILLPTMLMGATFPVAFSLYSRRSEDVGKQVGGLYAVNTVGGVLGSVCAGFVILPLLGMKSGVMLLAILNVMLGLVLLLVRKRNSLTWLGSAVTLVVLVSVVLWMPQWDKRLLTSGVYFNAMHYIEAFKRGDLDSLLVQERNVVYYKEGAAATVSVNRSGDHLDLAINGKVTAAVPENIFTHTLLGALPVMVHGDAKRAMVVGLASGVTVGALEQFPLEKIDVVEISPEVVEASQYFSDYNHDALNDVRVNIIIDDARAYLSYGGEKYDVIISEPPLPLSSAVANLFTREFYQVMRDGLASGGIAAQWLHTYGLSTDDMKTAMRTFADVFPHVSFWQYDVENTVLLGSMEEMVLDYTALQNMMDLPEVSALMNEVGVKTPEAVIGGFVMANDTLRTFVGEGVFNTDDHPLIEFAVPRTLFSSTGHDNYNDVVQVVPVSKPPFVIQEGASGYVMPFLGVVANPGTHWDMQYAGFNILNAEYQNGDESLRKQVMPVAYWVANKDSHAVYLKLSRHVGGGLQSDVQFLDGVTSAVIKNSGVSNDLKRPWWLVSGKGRDHLFSTWQCQSKGQRFVAEMVFPGQVDAPSQIAAIASEVLDGMQCLQE